MIMVCSSSLYGGEEGERGRGRGRDIFGLGVGGEVGINRIGDRF